MSQQNPGSPNRNRIVISLEDQQSQPQPKTPPRQVQPLAGGGAPGGYQGPAPGGRQAQPAANYQRQDVVAARPPKKRSRVLRVLMVLVVLLLVVTLALGAGGFLYWRSFQTTPAYSLALLADAAQRGDTQTFNDLVDVDKVADNFVPQITEKVSAQFGGLLAGPIKALVDKLISQFLPGVKTQVREEINKRVKEAGEKAKDYPFPLVALGIKWETSIKENGDTAQATLTIKDRPVELTLQRAGDRWKIVGAKDDALAQQVADQIIKKLPQTKTKGGGGILGQAKDEIEKRLPGILGGGAPNPTELKKQAEEKVKNELEERVKQNLPPALRDQLPSGSATPQPAAKPPVPPKPAPPKPKASIEP